MIGAHEVNLAAEQADGGSIFGSIILANAEAHVARSGDDASCARALARQSALREPCAAHVLAPRSHVRDLHGHATVPSRRLRRP